MKSLLLLSILTLLATPALARIGETREQCEARYGKPVEVEKSGRTTVHHKSGIEIRCTYLEDVCYLIGFGKLELDSNVKPLPLSEDEKVALMSANSNNRPWTKTESSPDGKSAVWQCGDLKATYKVEPLNRLIIANHAVRKESGAKPGDPLRGF